MVLADALRGAGGWGLQLFPSKPVKPGQSLVQIPLGEGTSWEDGLSCG